MPTPNEQYDPNARAVEISNFKLERVASADTVSHALDLCFDVARDNSWREVPEIGEGTNWDAVWLFVKHQVDTRFKLPRDVAVAFYNATLKDDFYAVADSLGEYRPRTAKEDGDEADAPAMVENSPTIKIHARPAIGQGTGEVRFVLDDQTQH